MALSQSVLITRRARDSKASHSAHGASLFQRLGITKRTSCRTHPNPLTKCRVSAIEIRYNSFAAEATPILTIRFFDLWWALALLL